MKNYLYGRIKLVSSIHIELLTIEMISSLLKVDQFSNLLNLLSSNGSSKRIGMPNSAYNAINLSIDSLIGPSKSKMSLKKEVISFSKCRDIAFHILGNRIVIVFRYVEPRASSAIVST